MNRQEWLEARRGCLTATDISAVVGINPHRTALDVFLDKMGELPDKPDNAPMEWGRRLEPVVASRYAEDRGVSLIPGVFKTVVGSTWIGGTPDFLVQDEPRGLEVKTANAYVAKQWGPSGSDQVPEHYLAQCAWYMTLCDLPSWDLAVLIGGSDYRVYNLSRDKELEATLLEIGERFWKKHVLTKIPPEVDGSKRAEQFVKQKFQHVERQLMLDASEEIAELGMLYRAAEERAHIAEMEFKAIENRIKFAIGEAKGIKCDLWQATWTDCKGRETTKWEEIARECGASSDLIRKYTTRGAGHRRFDFTIFGEEKKK